MRNGIVVAVLAVCLVGCSKAGKPPWTSPYSVEYTMASPNRSDAVIEITVKGPAAKLAVVLTDPQGKALAQIIEKEEMITNSKTVQVPMDNPQEGGWKLQVKTVEPEKLVWGGDIRLSLARLSVKDARFDLVMKEVFMPGEFLAGSGKKGYVLDNVKVDLEKEGNLPIKFTGVSITVDGDECSAREMRSGETMTDQKHTIDVPIYADVQRAQKLYGTWNTVLFQRNSRHSMKVTLLYGNDHKSLVFEKEFTVPQTP